MGILLQTLINGIMLGSVYAMVALGLTLIYGILNVPNFAHGTLYMIGAYIAYFAIVSFGAPYWLGLIISMILLFVIGILLERIVFRPFYDKPLINSFIVAVGLILVLENTALSLWGPEFRQFAGPSDKVIEVMGVMITAQRLIVIITAAVLIWLVHLFIKKTRLGAAIEATSQNPDGALLMGINISQMRGITFGIGTALAAVAAALVGPILLIYPAMGHTVIGMAFVIIIIGGMGSFFGAVLGGYLIGILETFVTSYITNFFTEAIIFGLLVLLLAVRPTGLFGKPH
ncbi:MAG TPA: branched-chain amino acid ABC transporter permease [Syntrophales bacterium]|nr:branched-chain amino acid ABC transporter permease [Syntrophales bacterium]HOL58541.1 branched-chain amino acid ABC transporter permease [Syntrophales bacterium]HPO34851.1 branched-chain amino acid ABC transporter permease [Syntrophales bacterium]